MAAEKQDQQLQIMTSSVSLKKWETSHSKLTPDTVSKAIEGQQLSLLNKQEPKMLKVVLMKIIKETLPPQHVNEMMLKMVTQTLLTKYFYFRLGEFAMVLSKGAMGFYGNTPGGAINVLHWLHEYDTKERLDHFQSEAMKHKEGFEKSFREEQRKEAQEMKELTLNKMKNLKAINEAKRKVDGK